MGQQTWQVVGQAKEISRTFSYEPSADDIDTVAQQTGKSNEQAAVALRETNGDIAEAILKLQ
jgi:nascent polypeptide-associated complex subunit alpha